MLTIEEYSGNRNKEKQTAKGKREKGTGEAEWGWWFVIQYSPVSVWPQFTLQIAWCSFRARRRCPDVYMGQQCTCPLGYEYEYTNTYTGFRSLPRAPSLMPPFCLP